jgi:hypothetical protein
VPGIYRSIGWGFPIRLTPTGEFDTGTTEDIATCAEIYQIRRLRFPLNFSPVGNVFTMTGFYADRGDAHNDWRSSLMTFEINDDPKLEFLIPGTRGKVVGPSFRPFVGSLGDFFAFVRQYEIKFKELIGLGVTELQVGLASLSKYISDIFDGPGAYTCLARGMILVETSWLIERLAENARSLSKTLGIAVDQEQLVSKFLDFMMATPTKFDLFVQSGCGCLVRLGALTLIDLSLIALPLNNLMLDLRLDSTMRQIKGSHFEKTVAERIMKDVPEISFVIRPNVKLKRLGERDAFAEADLYIRHHQFLIVVDCKAYSITRSFLVGERRDVENRWGLVCEWLRESDRRAAEIAKSRRDSNYQVPESLSHVVPIVCSAFPEFICSLCDEYFLVSGKIPRVCIYDELVEFLKNLKPPELLSLPFTIPISR